MNDFLLGELLVKTVYALPWLVGGFVAIALVSWGPLGRALRRLSQARSEELALLRSIAESTARINPALEEIAERQDFLERALAQRPPAPLVPRPEVRDVTPH